MRKEGLSLDEVQRKLVTAKPTVGDESRSYYASSNSNRPRVSVSL